MNWRLNLTAITENFYNDKMDAVVDVLSEKGLLLELVGVPIVYLLRNMELNPALIKKSDGATLYLSRETWPALYTVKMNTNLLFIYFVCQEQSAHFKQLKAVSCKRWATIGVDTLPTFLLLWLKEGKISSLLVRIVLLLEPTVAEAVSRVPSQIVRLNPELENKDQVAHAVGVGASLNSILKSLTVQLDDFVLEAMVSPSRVNGPYVQYAYALISNLSYAKPISNQKQLATIAWMILSWEIIKLIHKFSRIINSAAQITLPLLSSKFAISLAQSFNTNTLHIHILVESPEHATAVYLSATQPVVFKESLFACLEEKRQRRCNAKVFWLHNNISN